MLQEVLHTRFEQFSSAAQQKTSKTDMDYHLDTLLASSSRNAKVRASAALATQLAEPASGAFARAHSAHLGSLVVVAWRAREAGDGALALSCAVCAFLAAEACALAAPRRREELAALAALLAARGRAPADDSGSEASPTKRRKRRGFFARGGGALLRRVAGQMVAGRADGPGERGRVRGAGDGRRAVLHRHVDGLDAVDGLERLADPRLALAARHAPDGERLRRRRAAAARGVARVEARRLDGVDEVRQRRRRAGRRRDGREPALEVDVGAGDAGDALERRRHGADAVAAGHAADAQDVRSIVVGARHCCWQSIRVFLASSISSRNIA